MRQIPFKKHSWRAAAAALALVTVLVAGCKHQQAAAPTDEQVANAIQAKIQGESALTGQDIQVSVNNGVATLSGTVNDDASRALAGNDSGTVSGVKTVVNNLTVQPPHQAAASPAPSAPPQQAPERRARPERTRREQAQMTPPPAMTPQHSAAQPGQQRAPLPPPPPPAPPKPVAKQVTLAQGTQIPIRLTEALDTKTIQTNDVFHGTVAQDVMEQGMVVIPQGAPVLGRVVEAREAAHFKGNALLSIQLTQVSAYRQKIGLDTDTFTQAAAGRGKNTAEKAGGGALLGALVGALAGGGKGAAIGAIAGGGAGAGVNAVTRGKQVVLASETIVNFHLQSPIVVTVPPPGSQQSSQENADPQLMQR
jgi:hypothetical protein